MVKKHDHSFEMMAIVAIVAVVGLIIMFMNVKSTDSDLAGEGIGIKDANKAKCYAVDSFDDCKPYGMCDATSNGEINTADVQVIFNYASGNFDSCGTNGNDCFCDLDQNGRFNRFDWQTLFELILYSDESLSDSLDECYAVDSFDDCKPYGMCDANSNGEINTADVQVIFNYAIGNFDSCGTNGNDCYCDLDNSGVVNEHDWRLLFNLILS